MSKQLSAVLVAALVAGAFSPSLAMAPNDEAQPTFYRDVLPILQANCQTCHRSAGENIGGTIAPMALLTYEDTRPWAKAIARAVSSRAMPPWFATAATRGQFHHERVLSDDDIAAVVGWVNGGANAGDAADAPLPRKFVEEGSGGWSLGKPDLIVKMPERYWVADEIADININFSTKITAEMLPEDMWVRGIEFRVGGTHVHHMCASASKPGQQPALGKFGGNSLGCIALGAESQRMPDGYAMKLEKGSSVGFSLHYNKEAGAGSGFFDQSEIGFTFADGDASTLKEVQFDPIGNLTFEIPPNQDRWKVGAARVFPVDTELLALWPHAHLRAVGARYEAFYPDGTSELLLDVPNYDQAWQTTYQYKTPKAIPGGTRVQVTMWYDNTAERGRERGYDHTKGVLLGTATTDEMMLGFISYASSRKVDQLQQLLGIAPPTSGSPPTSGGGQ